MARVMVVGSGWMFTSGISYYTCRLSNELAKDHEVSALLMRRLVPRRLYPGVSRVGIPVNSSVAYDSNLQVFEGVDWYWGPSLPRALRFMRDNRPEVVVLQWWTGAVLHSYLAIAAQARRLGARLVIEFHEVQDTGETSVPLASQYVSKGLPRLIRASDALIVHSEFDRDAIESAYGPLPPAPIAVIPHGPYDQHLDPTNVVREPRERIRVLYFGTIRPYKGLEDLVEAFDLIDDDKAAAMELRIVGETWEGWDLPLRMVEKSRHRDRISVLNRYVTDGEVATAFANADIVALPYRRSSASGPLHIAMASGLPVVTTSVGGLIEAAEGYGGLVLVPAADPVALRDGILRAVDMTGSSYSDVRSWADTRAAFTSLLRQIDTD